MLKIRRETKKSQALTEESLQVVASRTEFIRRLRKAKKKKGKKILKNLFLGNLNLSGLKLKNIIFINVEFVYCNFQCDVANDVVFQSCTFKDVSLVGSSFKKLTFEDCLLNKVNCMAVKFAVIYCNSVHFSECNFTNAKIRVLTGSESATEEETQEVASFEDCELLNLQVSTEIPTNIIFINNQNTPETVNDFEEREIFPYLKEHIFAGSNDFFLQLIGEQDREEEEGEEEESIPSIQKNMWMACRDLPPYAVKASTEAAGQIFFSRRDDFAMPPFMKGAWEIHVAVNKTQDLRNIMPLLLDPERGVTECNYKLLSSGSHFLTISLFFHQETGEPDHAAEYYINLIQFIEKTLFEQNAELVEDKTNTSYPIAGALWCKMICTKDSHWGRLKESRRMVNPGRHPNPLAQYVLTEPADIEKTELQRAQYSRKLQAFFVRYSEGLLPIVRGVKSFQNKVTAMRNLLKKYLIEHAWFLQAGKQEFFLTHDFERKICNLYMEISFHIEWLRTYQEIADNVAKAYWSSNAPISCAEDHEESTSNLQELLRELAELAKSVEQREYVAVLEEQTKAFIRASNMFRAQCEKYIAHPMPKLGRLGSMS